LFEKPLRVYGFFAPFYLLGVKNLTVGKKYFNRTDAESSEKLRRWGARGPHFVGLGGSGECGENK
ncbi:hypothetical protein CEN44_26500, partial [Fischerella muscicola CCMEE 5323]